MLTIDTIYACVMHCTTITGHETWHCQNAHQSKGSADFCKCQALGPINVRHSHLMPPPWNDHNAKWAIFPHLKAHCDFCKVIILNAATIIPSNKSTSHNWNPWGRGGVLSCYAVLVMRCGKRVQYIFTRHISWKLQLSAAPSVNFCKVSKNVTLIWPKMIRKQRENFPRRTSL